MTENARVMVLDDESIVCERLTEHLTQRGFTVEAFTESQAAIDRLAEHYFDVLVTDVKMKGPTGLDVMHFVRTHHPGTQVIVITGYASVEAYREAEYSGAFDFIAKPLKMQELATRVKRAAHKAAKLKGKAKP